MDHVGHGPGLGRAGLGLRQGRMGRQRLADQPGQFGIVEGLPPVAGQGHGVRLRGQTGTLGAEEGRARLLGARQGTAGQDGQQGRSRHAAGTRSAMTAPGSDEGR